MLKHLIWKDDNSTDKGRIAVRLHNDKLTIAQLWGKAPPVEILRTIWPLIAEEANRLHLTRSNLYRVETRRGMSGYTDFLLRILRDVDLLDAPYVAHIHVSMCGKLNRPTEIWLGDLPPLMRVMEVMKFFSSRHLVVEEVPTTDLEVWNNCPRPYEPYEQEEEEPAV